MSTSLAAFKKGFIHAPQTMKHLLITRNQVIESMNNGSQMKLKASKLQHVEQLMDQHPDNSNNTLKHNININDTHEVPSHVSGDISDCPDVVLAIKFLNIRRSAIKRGKEFGLSLKDVDKLLKRKTCYYTGVKFSQEESYVRTFDRVDSTKGYIPGNVVACTKWANDYKNHLFEDTGSVLFGKAKHLLALVEKVNSKN